MRIVTGPEALDLLRRRGQVFVWTKAYRCCAGRQYVLEASVEQPPGTEFELAYCCDGYEVHLKPGLRAPDELHFELDRKGRVHAYWNGQGWIG